MFTENWDKLTPDQRYEERMQAWFAMEADIPFVSDEVRETWRERVQMLRDAIELRKQARAGVPHGWVLRRAVFRAYCP